MIMNKQYKNMHSKKMKITMKVSRKMKILKKKILN